MRIAAMRDRVSRYVVESARGRTDAANNRGRAKGGSRELRRGGVAKECFHAVAIVGEAGRDAKPLEWRCRWRSSLAQFVAVVAGTICRLFASALRDVWLAITWNSPGFA
jgi:hypothetical protein